MRSGRGSHLDHPLVSSLLADVEVTERHEQAAHPDSLQDKWGDFARFCMVLHGFAWFCMVLHGHAWSRMVAGVPGDRGCLAAVAQDAVYGGCEGLMGG